MPRRVDIDWKQIREAYESGETNVLKLAERFGVSDKQIHRRRKSEQWATNVQIGQEARSNVVDMFSRKIVEAIGGEKALEDNAHDIAENLRRIKTLQTLGGDLLERTLLRGLGRQDANGQDIAACELKLGQHQGETSAVLDLLNAISKYTRDTRIDAGVPDGSPSAKPEEDDGRRRIHFVPPQQQTA